MAEHERITFDANRSTCPDHYALYEYFFDEEGRLARRTFEASPYFKLQPNLHELVFRRPSGRSAVRVKDLDMAIGNRFFSLNKDPATARDARTELLAAMERRAEALEAQLGGIRARIDKAKEASAHAQGDDPLEL